MLVLIAFGVMNLPAMIGVALIIAIEKVWRFGEMFARVVGVSALVYAALVGIEPSLAPGLDPGVIMNDDMEMDDDMEAPVPAVEHDPMGMDTPRNAVTVGSVCSSPRTARSPCTCARLTRRLTAPLRTDVGGAPSSRTGLTAAGFTDPWAVHHGAAPRPSRCPNRAVR